MPGDLMITRLDRSFFDIDLDKLTYLLRVSSAATLGRWGSWVFCIELY